MNNWTFQYHTEVDAEHLRKSLVYLTCQCLESRTPISKAEFYKTIPKLIYGRYPLKGGRDIKTSVDELLWKYSELTGKYCGCQFWSNRAKIAFESKLLEHASGKPPTSIDVKEVTNALSKKTRKEHQLVHEHVFPRAELRKLLEREISLGSQRLAETLQRLAVGCVVLASEHTLVHRTKGDSINPWNRYTGSITLCENENWPAIQLELIKGAGLL
jgi:hypothetical protein